MIHVGATCPLQYKNGEIQTCRPRTCQVVVGTKKPDLYPQNAIIWVPFGAPWALPRSILGRGNLIQVGATFPLQYKKGEIQICRPRTCQVVVSEYSSSFFITIPSYLSIPWESPLPLIFPQFISYAN